MWANTCTFRELISLSRPILNVINMIFQRNLKCPDWFFRFRVLPWPFAVSQLMHVQWIFVLTWAADSLFSVTLVYSHLEAYKNKTEKKLRNFPWENSFVFLYFCCSFAGFWKCSRLATFHSTLVKRLSTLFCSTISVDSPELFKLRLFFHGKKVFNFKGSVHKWRIMFTLLKGFCLLSPMA